MVNAAALPQRLLLLTINIFHIKKASLYWILVAISMSICTISCNKNQQPALPADDQLSGTPEEVTLNAVAFGLAGFASLNGGTNGGQ